MNMHKVVLAVSLIMWGNEPSWQRSVLSECFSSETMLSLCLLLEKSYCELCVLTLLKLKLAQKMSLPAARYDMASKKKKDHRWLKQW